MANIFRPSTWLGTGSSRQNDSTSDARKDATTSRGSAEQAVDVKSAPTPTRREAAKEVPIREQIEERAYFLWREAGCPADKDVDYWLLAEHEILERRQRL